MMKETKMILNLERNNFLEVRKDKSGQHLKLADQNDPKSTELYK